MEEEFPLSPHADEDGDGIVNGRLHEQRLAHFLDLLTRDNEIDRWKAAEALGRMEDPAAVESLTEALWDDDARVRLKAAWALGRIGDPRAIASLRRLYRIEDEWAQEIIREALENIRRISGQ